MTLVPDLTSCDWMRANPCSQSVKSLVKHLSRVVYGTTTAYKSLFFVKWDFSAVTYGSNNQLSTYIRSCSVHFIDCSHIDYREKQHVCLYSACTRGIPALQGAESKPSRVLQKSVCQALNLYSKLYHLLCYFSLSLTVIFSFSLAPQRDATNKLQNKVGQ